MIDQRNRRFPLLALAVLLALAGTGCGAAGGTGDRDTVDLRPQWTPGDVFTIREEEESRGGRGPYPPEGDILARTEHSGRQVRIYRVEILEGGELGLARARFTYLRSDKGEGEKLASDALAGKSYEVIHPLGNLEAYTKVDGSLRPAPANEAGEVRSTALRMAMSIVPAEPVAVGETWKAGRNPVDFMKLAKGPIRIVPRLKAIEEREGKRFARVECDTDAQVQQGKEKGGRLAMRETLYMDLTDARPQSYHSVTEWSLPPGRTHYEEWRRITWDLTVTPE